MTECCRQAMSRFHSHRASIATSWCSFDARAGRPCLDSTAIEHRSRPPRWLQDWRSVLLDPTAIEHRSRPAVTLMRRNNSSTSLDSTAIEHRSRHRDTAVVRRDQRLMSRFHSHRASIATYRSVTLPVGFELSRFHSHRASIATIESKGTRAMPVVVSIPQPSSIDRDLPDGGSPSRGWPSLDSTAIEHRLRPSASTSARCAASCLDSTAIEHRSRPSGFPPGTKPRSSLDSTAIEHRLRPPRYRFATPVSIPSLDSTAIEHRSRLICRRRPPRGRQVSIPQPSSIDRDVRGQTLRDEIDGSLDSTAIEHRSRPVIVRLRPSRPICLDSTAIEHRSRLGPRRPPTDAIGVSIPQPSSIDRDGCERRGRSTRSCLDSTAIEHRSRPSSLRATATYADRVSIPQPSSIDRDSAPSVLSVFDAEVSIPQPSSIDRDLDARSERRVAVVRLDSTAIEHRSRPWPR